MSLLLVNAPMLPEGAATGGGLSFLDWQRGSLQPHQYYSLPMEHLGLMAIAAYARARGLQVETINGLVLGHSSLSDTWQAMNDAARRSGPPEVIGLSTIDRFDEVRTLASLARGEWPDAVIVLGNTLATLNYPRILQGHSDLFDAVVVGEGEAPFVQLAEAVLEGRSADGIPGVARPSRDCSAAAVRPSVVDLDDLPWPLRSELPAVLAAGFAPAVFSTRGCPYRCTFCGTGATSALAGRLGYRHRAIEDVVDEIEYLVRDFGIEFLSISDDLFLSKHPSMQDRARRFAAELARRKVGIKFMIDARVDSMSDLELFAELRSAGLQRVFVGLETGSYEQLVSYGKRHVRRGEDPATRIRAVQDLGIEVIPGTIMFHPEASPSELRETARLIRETGYAAPRKLIERMVAYPGTPLYADYEAKGYLVSDWPIGEWEFPDPALSRVHADLSEYLRSRPDTTFDEAESYLLELLDSWEMQIRPADRDGRKNEEALEWASSVSQSVGEVATP